jgi:hypothetical protein
VIVLVTYEIVVGGNLDAIVGVDAPVHFTSILFPHLQVQSTLKRIQETILPPEASELHGASLSSSFRPLSQFCHVLVPDYAHPCMLPS